SHESTLLVTDLDLGCGEPEAQGAKRPPDPGLRGGLDTPVVELEHLGRLTRPSPRPEGGHRSVEVLTAEDAAVECVIRAHQGRLSPDLRRDLQTGHRGKGREDAVVLSGEVLAQGAVTRESGIRAPPA